MLAKGFEQLSIGGTSESSDSGQENESIISSQSTSSSEEPLDFGRNGYFPVTNGLCLRNQYKFLNLLGSGSFATVHKVEDIEAKSTVVLKIGRSGEVACKKEIAILELVSGCHENVVQFMGHFSVFGPYGKHSVMVFELLGSDLSTILKCAKKPLNFSTVRKYSKDILTGLEHIHAKCGVVHRDIKPENLMISETGALKIGDFGLAVLNAEGCTRFVGTCEYMAPEVFSGSAISFPVDIWSFGCTLFEMVNRLKLFGRGAPKNLHIDEKLDVVFDEHSIFESNPEPWLSSELLKVWRPDMEKEEAKVISAFLEKLLKSDPKKRLTAREAVEDPFFVDC
ncbi:hypothetical protein CAEBREN_13662 [Caenorhabditis brenneri]|uniref:non-specific serine/threonine protein kinase n=1 Tax=Caenorhabditis brenneri TaxID=135651 RepID=G0P2N0_CAEBE|nr:hypothetical protein CAEBREN_13662 [Caenorhabditis brenneri]